MDPSFSEGICSFLGFFFPISNYWRLNPWRSSDVTQMFRQVCGVFEQLSALDGKTKESVEIIHWGSWTLVQTFTANHLTVDVFQPWPKWSIDLHCYLQTCVASKALNASNCVLTCEQPHTLSHTLISWSLSMRLFGSAKPRRAEWLVSVWPSVVWEQTISGRQSLWWTSSSFMASACVSAHDNKVGTQTWKQITERRLVPSLFQPWYFFFFIIILWCLFKEAFSRSCQRRESRLKPGWWKVEILEKWNLQGIIIHPSELFRPHFFFISITCSHQWEQF